LRIAWLDYKGAHEDERTEAAEQQANQIGGEEAAKCAVVPGAETFDCVIDAPTSEGESKATQYDLKVQQDLAHLASKSPLSYHMRDPSTIPPLAKWLAVAAVVSLMLFGWGITG
jgi:hypothetical protein